MAQLKEKITYFDESFKEINFREIIDKSGKILKDTSRSYVKVVETKQGKILVKKPIEKNERKWIKFLTLFRKSEAIRVLESMKLLNDNKIRTNKPYMCIEYKQNGMVVDSIILCEYLDGNIVKKENSEEVLNLIKAIHKLGYLHGDTQMRNFLSTGDEVVTIDSTLKPKLYGAVSENYEYIGFAIDIEEAYNYIDKEKLSYRLADFFINYLELRED